MKKLDNLLDAVDGAVVVAAAGAVVVTATQTQQQNINSRLTKNRLVQIYVHVPFHQYHIHIGYVRRLTSFAHS
jgi:hypothetical protein